MKKRTNSIILMLILLLAVIGAIAAWLLTRPPDTAKPDMAETDAAKPDIVVLESASAEQTPPDGIQIPGYPTLSVDSATGTVSTVFGNPEGNRCYFELTLVRTDTDEELWNSVRFKPGTGIRNPVLNATLPPGTYPATLTYTTTSLENETPMNGAAINTELVVE